MEGPCYVNDHGPFLFPAILLSLHLALLLLREAFFVNTTFIHSFAPRTNFNASHTISTNNDFLLDTLSFTPRGATAYSHSFSSFNTVQLDCATAIVNLTTTLIHIIGQCLPSLSHTTRILHCGNQLQTLVRLYRHSTQHPFLVNLHHCIRVSVQPCIFLFQH